MTHLAKAWQHRYQHSKKHIRFERGTRPAWAQYGHIHGVMLLCVDPSGELAGTLCGRQAVPCLVPAVKRTQAKSGSGDRRT